MVDFGPKDIGISDHHLVYATRKLSNKTVYNNPCKEITYFDWHFSPAAFQASLRAISWDNLYVSDDADTTAHIFTQKLNIIIPTLRKKRKFVHSSTHIAHHDHLKRSGMWEAYKKQQNLTTNLIKLKKKNHIFQLIKHALNKQTKEL